MVEQVIGIKPVDKRLSFDTGAVESYLGELILGLEGPLQLAQIKGGQSNPTYCVTAADGRRFVVRRKPPGKLLPSAHAVDREFIILHALHATGFPVARPYVLCQDDSIIGTAFYVMDYVEGRVLWDQSLPGMSKSERFSIWSELNRVIALLHTIDFRVVGSPIVLFLRAILKGQLKKRSQGLSDFTKQMDYLVWAVLFLIGCGVAYSIGKLIYQFLT